MMSHDGGTRLAKRNAMKPFLPLGVIVLLACGADDATGPATSGLYRLQLATVTDTCDIPRGTGEIARVIVLEDEPGWRLHLPGLGSNPPVPTANLIPVARDAGPSTWTYEPCPATKQVVQVEVLEERPDRLQIRWRDTWSGGAGCDLPFVPENDCVAEQVLTYDLVNECALPCEIVGSRCPEGGEICAPEARIDWSCICPL
jgi:hypothetical protein